MARTPAIGTRGAQPQWREIDRTKRHLPREHHHTSTGYPRSVIECLQPTQGAEPERGECGVPMVVCRVSTHGRLCLD